MDKNNTSALIDAGAVKALLTHHDVVIVDARGGGDARERYLLGHIEGSIFMNLETDLSQKSADAAHGGRHPLPDPKAFGILLGNAGISPSSHILVYDDKAGANAAARFWWMMKAAGHTKVQVIDGGLKALEQEGHPLTSAPNAARAPKDPYPVSAWQLPVANIDEVDRARLKNDALVIDVREGYRYRGESEPIDLVAGHVPGAINMPYLENLTPNGTFRPANELADLYKRAIGNRDAENVVVHCGSGVTACHTLLAMEVAGLQTPRLYVGSWSEWSRNPKPIAGGEKP